MLRHDIEYCSDTIAQEERLAELAPNREVGCLHLQLAMLYKAELAILLRQAEEIEAQSLAASHRWPSFLRFFEKRQATRSRVPTEQSFSRQAA